MSRPLIIAGHASGVGKTTVATGLMGAFRRKGLKVAPFKVGPDYIDPGYHRRASGAPSRNLDTWLTPAGTVRSIYRRGSRGADVSVIEGVMGLFDGRAGGGDEGSTAEVAGLTGGAVVLVADCRGLGRSLAPLLWGFSRFSKGTALGGVILNRAGGPGHLSILRDAAREAGVPVLGELPRAAGVTLSSRHLGLVPEAEQEEARERIEAATDLVERNVDLEALLAIARAEGEGPVGGREGMAGLPDGPACDGPGKTRARIAVARDEAFSFYYEDSLEALCRAGAELVWFSPLRDDELPECDGVYLGGGFPEIFAAGLEDNFSMRRSIAGAVEEGLPVYAECGGMVYLCRGLEVGGVRHEMAGAIGSEARMTGSRQALGYVEARARRGSILLRQGSRVRGHEFHWSSVKWQDDRLAYDCFSGRRPEVEQDGYLRGNLLASYVHIHFAGDSGAAERFVSSCARARSGVGG